MTAPDTGDITTEDVARAQRQAQRDASPDGRKMLNATLLPEDERTDAPIADAE